MLLYIFVAVWPLILKYLYKYMPLKVNHKNVKMSTYIVLAMLPIFILLAFRSGNMGADAGTYVKHFESMIDTPLSKELETSRMEPGYLIFVKAITYITHSGLVYQVICVSIMMIGLFDFLKEQGEDALTFLYFYCTLGLFFFMFTGTRQCLAMSICLFSYKYIKRKKYISFALCILLAFFFHKSAVLFAVVPFVMLMKVSVINTAIYIMIAVVAGRYLQSIQTWINETLDYSYELEETDSGIIFLVVLLLFTIFSFLQLYNAGYLKYFNKRFTVSTEKNDNVMIQEGKTLAALININFVTLFFWILRLQTRVAERPSYYFLFFSCLLFAKALNNIKDKHQDIYILLVYGFTMLLYVYRLSANFASFMPYQFYS